MSKKRKSPNDPTLNEQAEAAYVTWGNTQVSRDKATKAMSEAVESYVGVSSGPPVGRSNKSRTQGGYFQDYSDLATNVSGKPGFGRDDYDKFRPKERVARSYKGAIQQSDTAYNNVGIIRNIIDLMGDFASRGVRVTHPNKKIEKFYKNWFKKVRGPERSERFLNNLFRVANVVVRKQTATLKKNAEDRLYKTSGKPDLEIEKKEVFPREIPWRYTFLDPMLITPVGGCLASFVEKPRYAIQLPRAIAQAIMAPTGPEEKRLVSKLPTDIKNAAKKNTPYILPPDKTSVFHYKKDDWRPWAYPMIHAIMDDINILEKLKLADVSALDGAISNVRIFKLGNLEHKIAPTPVAANKLAEILENNVGGSTMDLIWGPDIELLESQNNVHQFLGEAKYLPHLNNIYAGLGIPPTLTGTFGAAGTTNNFISLKTLIQRLEYGRTILSEFWLGEFVAVQEAMEFRFAATLEYDINDLGDEAAEKALLIQLSDRNLISEELLQHRFGSDPDMERIRTNREDRERNGNQRQMKAGAFHDPQYGVALKKMALQQGIMTPNEVGLTLTEKRQTLRVNPRKKGEKPALELKTKPAPNKKGVPQQGRPKNSKDSKKRKTKEFKPKVKADELWIKSVEMWARDAQGVIADELNGFIVGCFNKKTMRNLTATELLEAEQIKFGVLYNLEPLSSLSLTSLKKALDKGNVSQSALIVYNTWVQNVNHNLGRELTLDETRQLQVAFYAEEKWNGQY